MREKDAKKDETQSSELDTQSPATLTNWSFSHWHVYDQQKRKRPLATAISQPIKRIIAGNELSESLLLQLTKVPSSRLKKIVTVNLGESLARRESQRNSNMVTNKNLASAVFLLISHAFRLSWLLFFFDMVSSQCIEAHGTSAVQHLYILSSYPCCHVAFFCLLRILHKL